MPPHGSEVSWETERQDPDTRLTFEFNLKLPVLSHYLLLFTLNLWKHPLRSSTTTTIAATELPLPLYSRLVKKAFQ